MGLFGGYIIVFIVSAGTTAAIMPLVLAVARRRRWLAIPGERTVHTVPTPNIGGLGLLCGVAVALLAARQMDRFDRLFTGNSELIGVLLAAVIIALVGFRDDVREVSAPGRVAATILAGLVLVWFGVTMFYFRLPFLGVFQISGDWVPIVTVLWLLVMTQAINLIDGLDGLAAGIVAIGSGAFFVYSWHLSDNGLLSEPNIGPLIAVITCGVCIGFLPFNFNPARIFMGDSGSYLLGLLMSVSTSVVGGRADPTTQGFSGQTYFFLAPLFIPLIILGVPIFDVLFAIVRRVSRGTGFATADKGHLHHRLINLGHGPRRAVVILWAWTLLLSGFVLYPVFNPSANSIVTFGLFAIVLFLYTVLHPDLRIRREIMRRDSENTDTQSS
jgi:UDP-GlcNAc:undecaprenyl-phosphate GlcNAc-1-phosphate transferase